MQHLADHPAHASVSPPTPRKAWVAIWITLLLLWVLALLWGPDLIQRMGIDLNAHGHVSLYEHDHPFVDARTLWGMPNGMDVLSNTPLGLAGLIGLLTLRGKPVSRATRNAMAVFFAGLLLAGMGSAWYHWLPDASGLVVDRLGMAVTFAGAIAVALAERIDQRAAQTSLVAILATAIVSAALPFTHGNVLTWVVVQFGGMALILWAAMQTRLADAVGVNLGALIAIYVLAKLCELNDATLFHLSGEWISGHSLKHGVAALAVLPVIVALLRQNAQAPRPHTFSPNAL
ncbi:hypothetical protein [Rhodoferax sp. PAMC 29310]|uniref:hypothetical protein n=1 Tax=Rhodoferax sp. PAMC 29310 TaxID=2822760 RepID=UPI001B31BD15|nr:hypothetical protein [Rhodoferax sp. PAMC 29310]